MDDYWWVLLVALGWVALRFWVLPLFGVPRRPFRFQKDKEEN